MGKKATALTLMLALLFSAIGTPLFVNLGSAQFFPGEVLGDSSPVVSIVSPLNSTTFYDSLVSLNLTVSWGNFEDLFAIGYVLDGKPYGPFVTNNSSASTLDYPRNFSLILNLIPGMHSVQTYANVTGYKVSATNYPQFEPITVPAGWSDTVFFTTLPANPTVEIQPIEVTGTSLDLTFTVNEPVSKITYSLDNQSNVSIVGNTTLTSLSYGQHSIVVYATNPASNVGASQITNFTVALPPTKSQPFPMATVATVSAGVAVVVVAVLLVYFKKHKL